jgi:hypothetical protein
MHITKIDPEKKPQISGHFVILHLFSVFFTTSPAAQNKTGQKYF